MHVTLINYTPDAVETLIFTKNARLNATPFAFNEIKSWPMTKKHKELQYMAKTIPSSWEFVDYIFAIQGVTRAFTHQFVRTRTGSYAQQSLRVVDASGFGYRMGPSIEEKDLGGAVQSVLSKIDETYQSLLKKGVNIEDARGILPTNVHTNIIAKFNLRTLSEMVQSRSGGRTQDEYREVVTEMAAEVLKVHPWAVDFLYPRGQSYFDEIESLIAQIDDPNLKQDMLKAIDRMRKNR